MSKTNITVTSSHSLILTPTVVAKTDKHVTLRFSCQDNGHPCEFPQNTTLALTVTGPERYLHNEVCKINTRQTEATFDFDLSVSGDYSMDAVLTSASATAQTSTSTFLAASHGKLVLADTPTAGATERSLPPRAPVPVMLTRTASPTTPDEILWPIIRRSANALSFNNYKRCMDVVFCARPDVSDPPIVERVLDAVERAGTFAPGRRTDIYQRLKQATEVFIILNCCFDEKNSVFDPEEENDRAGHNVFDGPLSEKLNKYLGDARMLPYLAIVTERIGDDTFLPPFVRACLSPDVVQRCRGDFERRLQMPCFIELIWSYWHEEAMQTQTMNTILQRFQNRRASGVRDALAQLELDPLRPLNNLMWGFVQDEMSRLSVLRRAHEYDHEYGITLHGKAVAELRSADRPSKFLEALHNLLYQCVLFYRQDDDTTVVSDGFPVLNAVKETHYLLAQGAHNQFGDLPVISRQEMLMEQYTLARPEMGEFLRGRAMVPYPEEWMDRVDMVKTLKGWSDVSVVHFHDLAAFGEQILLSIRWNNWSQINDPNRAKNWARYWRQEIQGYIHAYRAVTGVDLASDVTGPSQQADRNLPPSVLLRRRLAAQQPTRG